MSKIRVIKESRCDIAISGFQLSNMIVGFPIEVATICPRILFSFWFLSYAFILPMLCKVAIYSYVETVGSNG